MSPLNAAICTTISYTLRVEWYYIKNNYLTLRLKVKVPQRSLQYMHGHAPTYWISLTYLERQKCYGLDKKILFKKQLFDLEVKVPWRSLWYATHRLMVMHSHTKYNWPIWKDKKVMVRTSFAEKKRKKKIKTKTICFPRGDIIKCLSINTCIPHPLLGCNNQHGFLDLRRETTCRSQHH
jgi:hypothetical protein